MQFVPVEFPCVSEVSEVNYTSAYYSQVLPGDAHMQLNEKYHPALEYAIHFDILSASSFMWCQLSPSLFSHQFFTLPFCFPMRKLPVQLLLFKEYISFFCEGH